MKIETIQIITFLLQTIFMASFAFFARQHIFRYASPQRNPNFTHKYNFHKRKN